ncbi:MAG: hypothetical protein RLZZ470_27, partial [Pseudomonadota bacterium]
SFSMMPATVTLGFQRCVMVENTLFQGRVLNLR